MRIRLLVTALAYAVYLLLLLLFPPFHDGLHHLYSWRPNDTQLDAFMPAWASGDWLRAHLPDLLVPDRLRLVFEALIGLVSVAFLFLLTELIVRFRRFRQQDLPFARSTLAAFLFDVH